jgi:hypothetical protein
MAETIIARIAMVQVFISSFILSNYGAACPSLIRASSKMRNATRTTVWLHFALFPAFAWPLSASLADEAKQIVRSHLLDLASF